MEGVQIDHLAQYLGEVAADWEPPAWQRPGMEQAIRLGGPGTPQVPEFAVCEVAAALGLTQPAATSLCADVLDLSYRLRGIATSVRAGALSFARARVIARRTRDLTREQAELVEARLCRPRDTGRGPQPMAALVPMSRLRTVIDQAVITVRGPETEAEAEARVAASLYVEVVHQVGAATDLAARLATADAARLDARLDQIAGWLTDLGDTRPKKILRAVALGLLADPALLGALHDLHTQHEPHENPTPAATPPTAPQPTHDAVSLPSASTRGSSATPQGSSPPPQLSPSSTAPPTMPCDRPEATASDPPWSTPPGASGEHTGPPARPAPDPFDLLPDPADRTPGTDASDPTGADPRPDPHASQPAARAAGVAGLPAGLLAKLGNLGSTVLYVHLDRPSGTWCAEGAGVLTKEQAMQILGHSNVSIRPVLDLAEPLKYTGYEAPPKLKEQLALLNAGYCTFPHCHRRARASDVDHQLTHANGGPTTTMNTHRLCRKHHRAKDKGHWRVAQPAPGIWIWASPAGATYLVTNGTTTPLNGILTRTTPPAESEPENPSAPETTANRPARLNAADPRTLDVPTEGHPWKPAWDPWNDWDPLTQTEHEYTYGYLNAG